MKIIVSIKQVPDTSGKVAVNPDGTLNRASMQTITNPDDMNALEAALKIKDATGCKVTVVTMGPPPAAGMLREALAMGADEAYLVSAREFGGSDTYATSQILARAMITRYGMSDDFDMVALETVTNQYLGGDASLACSAETQTRIDQQVVALVKREHQKALDILRENRTRRRPCGRPC